MVTQGIKCWFVSSMHLFRILENRFSRDEATYSMFLRRYCLTMKITLLFLATIIGYTVGQTKYCCAPDQWESRNTFLQGKVDHGTVFVLQVRKSRHVMSRCLTNEVLLEEQEHVQWVQSSGEHLRTKVTPDFHLTCSKNGGNLGSESK